MNDWIHCAQRMPPEGVYVLVYVPSGTAKNYLPEYARKDRNYGGVTMDVMRLEQKDNWFGVAGVPETTWYGDDDALLCGNDVVTHWMPLPSPPISQVNCTISQFDCAGW